MADDPTKHRILLVGPRVVHLKPFFERRRYNCVAVQKGVEGMTALDAEPRDIVILELNLGDLTATEFLMAARQSHAQASFLLLDDASKAGQIVKALQAGLDGYLPTPPDEDRLFFEVERHLRHSGGAGNGMNTGETLLTARPPEVSSLQTQVTELGMQNELLQQEIDKARDVSKVFAGVKNALFGVLEGDLDEDQAVRLKERLSMATVLETEVDALREELAGSKNQRRDLQENFDAVKKRVQELEARLDDKNIDSLEGAAVKEKMSEVESENMVLEGRIAELEEELDLAKAETVALEQKLKADVGDLQRELNRVSSDAALSTGDNARVAHEHKSEILRLRKEHEAALERQREEADAKLKNAVSDVEIERSTAKQKLTDAVAKREKELTEQYEKRLKELTERVARREKELEGTAAQTSTALQQQVLAVVAEREQAVEKALDAELIVDELKAKIEYLEGEVTKFELRAKQAEDNFKKDKLRLIEEKEVAASGSAEAFTKVQKYLDENAMLKRQNAELEAMRSTLEERGRAGDEAKMNAELRLEEATQIRAKALEERDTALTVSRAVEERCTALERRNASLESSLEELRQRGVTAEKVMADASATATRLADVLAARDALEKEAEKLGGKLADAEALVMRKDEELEQSKKTGGASEAATRELKERIQQLEDMLAEREAAEREAKETLVAMQREMDEQRKTLSDHYEQRLRDTASANPQSATSAAMAERDAYRQRLAETEAWVQQAQVHLEALRVERDQLGAQATALGNDATSRNAEVQELYSQLSTAKQQVTSLTGKAAGLEQELMGARQQTQYAQQQAAQVVQQAQQALAERTNVGVDPQALVNAQEEIKVLRQQLAARPQMQTGPDPQAFRAQQEEIMALRQQLQQMASGGGARLPEELEPLRWTLTAAIDAITALEAREPSLAAHLRNLRLLASTLSKLSPS